MKWHTLLMLPVLALFIFWPSFEGDFIMDDWGYITKNPAITKTLSPLVFWTSTQQPDYWPITYTSYWTLFKFFGEDPLGYHVINVFIHTLNALLVALLATELGAPWWCAFLFLTHPLHVQAVSWIVQFKTLLATTFALLTCLLFLRGSRKGSATTLALGMLTKSSLITLPIALFTLADERTKRIQALKLLLLSAAVGGFSYFVQETNLADRSAPVFNMPWWDRPFLAAQNWIHYLRLFAWPHPLGLTYDLQIPALSEISSWSQITTATLLFASALSLGSPILRRLALCYVILMLPGLGLLPLAGMKISLAFDHWAYLADAFLVMWFTQALSELTDWKRAAVTVGILSLVCVPLSRRHAQTFANEDVFWRQAAITNPRSAVPPYNLGTVLEKTLRLNDASKEYERAVQLDPEHGRAWYNLGRLKEINKDLAGARLCFQRSEELRARFPEQGIPAHPVL